MKQVVFVLPLFLAACSTTMGSMSSSRTASAKAQFDVIASLAGDWKGEANMGDPAQKVDVSYHTTAGGSAVEETLFKGSDHEMISMYHLDGDQLVMTHYCMMGNQPHLAAAPSSDPHSIAFDFVSGSNMDSSNDMHMHSMRLVVRDANHIESTWQGFKDGKPEHAAHFTLTRTSPKTVATMTTVYYGAF